MQEYEDNVPHLIKRNVVGRKYLSPFFIVVLVVCVISLFTAIGISRYQGRFLVLKKQEFYLLSLNECDDLQDANVLSQAMEKRGGAGFIYNNNDKFNIIADIYTDYNIAKSVLDKQPDGEIIKITCDRKQIPLIKSKQYSKNLYDKIKVVDEVFMDLLDSEIEFSKGNESLSYLVSKVLTGIEKVEKTKLELQNLYDANQDKEILLMVNYVSNALNTLNFIDKSNPNLSIKIKYALIELTLSKKSFQNKKY